MEAFDLLLTTSRDVSYLVLHHPALSAVGAVAVLALLVRFYCRLTLGVYEGDEDMAGKTVLVTGASAGIGIATATDLARRRARVIMACRDVDKGRAVAEAIVAATGNRDVVVRRLDLCSFASVAKCAEDVLESEGKLHVLVNNAGVMGMKADLTEDGHELVMQSNHLGHFLLTLLLTDLLKSSAPSRVVNVASEAYRYADLDVDDLDNKAKTASSFQVYSNSKLANILFTSELARRLAGTGVTVNSVHPGAVKTDIAQISKGLFAAAIAVIFLLCGKTREEGAQTTIRLAVDPSLEKTTGKYFADCREEELKAQGNDKELARRLFEASEKVVGITFPDSS